MDLNVGESAFEKAAVTSEDESVVGAVDDLLYGERQKEAETFDGVDGCDGIGCAEGVAGPAETLVADRPSVKGPVYGEVCHQLGGVSFISPYLAYITLELFDLNGSFQQLPWVSLAAGVLLAGVFAGVRAVVVVRLAVEVGSGLLVVVQDGLREITGVVVGVVCGGVEALELIRRDIEEGVGAHRVGAVGLGVVLPQSFQIL
jgi:hypothetical protein